MTKVYLIPTLLAEGAVASIPLYVMEAVKNCDIIFAENERTARRFLKTMDKSVVIDNYEWFTIDKHSDDVHAVFEQKIQLHKNIAIMSEAGCPGVADPGQALVAIAHRHGVKVIPLVGPSSILLALMASGLNGQQFEFVGYLPIDTQQRIQQINALQASSEKYNSTKIFIETPYRNISLFEQLLKTGHPKTSLCVAVNITGADEKITTLSIAQWKSTPAPEIHKKPVIFLLYSGKH